MANDVSTIQSLKAVDAWIDVINANINGGVRTAFKASRLRFAGSNTTLDRAPTTTSLPLQLPEPSLITANTVIDWTQGAITSSTETTHLAIQGEGFFVLVPPAQINTATGSTLATGITERFYVTRDGEFHTDANGLLRHASGYYLICVDAPGNGTFGRMSAVYNDIDNPAVNAGMTQACRLSTFISNTYAGATTPSGAALGAPATARSLMQINQGKQHLKYTSLGSTVFDIGYQFGVRFSDPAIYIQGASPSDATILSKSLEASNSSMTQSVPELSLAQKLFSALTKVLQIGQTNTDSVLNLVR